MSPAPGPVVGEGVEVWGSQPGAPRCIAKGTCHLVGV